MLDKISIETKEHLRVAVRRTGFGSECADETRRWQTIRAYPSEPTLTQKVLSVVLKIQKDKFRLQLKNTRRLNIEPT
jgi:hypothetical protein